MFLKGGVTEVCRGQGGDVDRNAAAHGPPGVPPDPNLRGRDPPSAHQLDPGPLLPHSKSEKRMLKEILYFKGQK